MTQNSRYSFQMRKNRYQNLQKAADAKKAEVAAAVAAANAPPPLPIMPPQVGPSPGHNCDRLFLAILIFAIFLY